MCGKKTLKYHKVYSQKTCLLEVMTDYIIEKCGCRDLYMPGMKFKIDFHKMEFLVVKSFEWVNLLCLLS